MNAVSDQRPRCRYCKSLPPDSDIHVTVPASKEAEWTKEQLANGYRYENRPERTKVYHCYAAYCD